MLARTASSQPLGAGDAERWINDIRAVQAAHEQAPPVRGALFVRVLEGRNLPSRDLSGVCNAYCALCIEVEERERERDASCYLMLTQACSRKW